MGNLLFEATLYGLGFLGLFGIAFLPLRVVVAIRHALSLRGSSLIGIFIFYIIIAVSLIAVALAGTQVAGVCRCLLGLHCSANRAGGWFFLVGVGVCYIAFEAFSVIVFALARRFARVAT